MSQDSTSSNISIVGAGPAGCLLACQLADQGFTVDVYEKRADPRINRVVAGRSINLALSERGLSALRQIDLEKRVLDIAVPMYGRIIHQPKVEPFFSAYGKTGTEAINSVSRADLNRLLLDATSNRKSGSIQVHFNSSCTGYDLATKELFIQNRDTSETRKIATEIVLGTDGSASAIREAMGKQHGLTQTQERLSHGYKELVIPASATRGFQLDKGGLHIWPRGSFLLIALPNIDGSFTCTIFLEKLGTRSFENLRDGDAVEAFFREHFPDVVSLIPDLRQSFLKNPLGNLDSVKCGPWHVGKQVCLLGDAAHAIIPFYGQGLNCALQDVTRYCDILKRSGSDFNLAHKVFFDERKPDADAISQLAWNNFVEMRDRVADPAFQRKKHLEHRLEELYPDRFMSTYARVTFNTGSYAEARDLGIIQDAILLEACASVTSLDQINMEVVLGRVEQAIAERNHSRGLDLAGFNQTPGIAPAINLNLS